MLNEIQALSCRVNAVLRTPCECGEYLVEATSAYLTTCENSTITLTAETTGRPVAYQWQILTAGEWVNAAGVSDESTYTSGVLAIGTYEYRVAVVDCHGCESVSDSITITVVANTLQIFISADDNDFCSGGETTLHAEVLFNAVNIDASPNLTVTWEYSTDGITYTPIVGAEGPTYDTGPLYGSAIVPPYGGTPHFFRGVANYNGCTSDTSPANTNFDQTIDVVGQPYVNLLYAEDDTICDGGFAVLHSEILGGAGSLFFQWQELIGGVWTNIVGAEGPALVTDALTEGTYQYRIIVNMDSGCYLESVPVYVFVVPDPVVTISVDDNSIAVGGEFTISSNVTGGSGTTVYQWQLFDLNATGWTNSDIFGANSSTFNNVAYELAFPSGFWDPIAAGTYQMRLAVYQDSGCETYSDPVTITVT